MTSTIFTVPCSDAFDLSVLPFSRLVVKSIHVKKAIFLCPWSCQTRPPCLYSCQPGALVAAVRAMSVAGVLNLLHQPHLLNSYSCHSHRVPVIHSLPQVSSSTSCHQGVICQGDQLWTWLLQPISKEYFWKVDFLNSLSIAWAKPRDVIIKFNKTICVEKYFKMT